MPVDPQVRVILDQHAASGPPMYTQSVEEARLALDMMGQFLWGEPEPVSKVEDQMIPGPAGQIPIRIYTPHGSGPFPILLMFHGGGYVLGNIEINSGPCRSLTNAAGCIVVSTDYRLAPEHKFPAAVEDGYSVTKWVAENASAIDGDPARIAVGGESAGANLAAVVALMARDRGTPPLVYQLLLYPFTNYAFDTLSYEECADGYLLTKQDMVWFWNYYLESEEDGLNPYASPARAQDLRGLPPTMVVTAEFDPLRDEGETYATRLLDSGVHVACKRYEGMIHGFFSFPLDQAKETAQELATGLRLAFAR